MNALLVPRSERRAARKWVRGRHTGRPRPFWPRTFVLEAGPNEPRDWQTSWCLIVLILSVSAAPLGLPQPPQPLLQTRQPVADLGQAHPVLLHNCRRRLGHVG